MSEKEGRKDPSGSGAAGQGVNLPLEWIEDLSRPLSTPEYYHACVGTSAETIEPLREAIFVLNGQGTLTEQACHEALKQVARCNPGLRLRVVGDGRRAMWRSDGPVTRLRMVDGVVWDGRSEVGSAFIYETRLDLRGGGATELIVATQPDNRTLLVFRALHAVMDGRGVTHFLHELFRALRGERLLGTNASFSDVDLMKSVGTRKSTSRHIKTISLTGGNQGTERGDTWRRLSLAMPQKNLLARVAEAMASFAHSHTAGTALMAIPVDLRRHLPSIASTLNYSSMLLVPMERGEGATAFKRKLQHMLNHKMEARYHGALDWVRLLPLGWFDRLVSRTPKNYTTKRPLETVLISNLGLFDLNGLRFDGFKVDSIYCLPLGGNACCVLSGTQDRVEITVCLSRLLAANGRLDGLMQHLEAALLSPVAANESGGQ